jgi:hypothetical protein
VNEQQFMRELNALRDQAYRESKAIEDEANAKLKAVAARIDDAIKLSASRNGMQVRKSYVVVGRVGGRTAAISVNP